MELTKRERDAVNAWMLEDRGRVEALEELVTELPDPLEEHARHLEEQVAKLEERVAGIERAFAARSADGTGRAK